MLQWTHCPQTVAEEWGIEAMPTFLFLKEGQLVDKVVGAKKDELQLNISKHATAAAWTWSIIKGVKNNILQLTSRFGWFQFGSCDYGHMK